MVVVKKRKMLLTAVGMAYGGPCDEVVSSAVKARERASAFPLAVPVR